MELIDRSYEGFYARFDPSSQKEGVLLMGADNIVGTDYEIVFKTENGINIAWAKNRFGYEMGSFDIDTSRKLQIAKGRGQTVRALLAFVGFSDTPEPGHYWGQMALFCYNPAYAAEMNAFIDRIAVKLGQGVRPRIDLGTQAVEKIFTEKDWIPSETVSFSKKDSNSVIMKDERTITDGLVEQARAGNKGCYVISIAFIVVVVLALLAGVAYIFGLF
ncbi:MAG: hypothetical protein IJI68_05950 [Eggerthellaceae bacterium]|nr:hypothetical protein [Eggerthellaceae bacterium]